MIPYTIELEHEKETKNTHRYDAVREDAPPPVENLYLQKWAVGEDPPERLELTIDELATEAATL